MTDRATTTEMSDRYSKIYPGAIADVLDDRGLEDQVLSKEIGPIANDMTVAGTAFPVVGRPNRSVDSDENIEKILEMLGDVPEDSVLMYETNDAQFSHIGELSVTALIESGCRGAVLDGGARDVTHILQRNFPVFSSHVTPADAVPRWEIIDWGVRAVVGGVSVSPGDVVVGDIDGVIVVPQNMALEVLEEAEALAETEDKVRTDVENGATPMEAYEKHGKF